MCETGFIVITRCYRVELLLLKCDMNVSYNYSNSITSLY